MKTRYFIIAIVTLFSTAMISCDDFLEEDPRGLLTPDNFFKNEDEAKLALNGLQGKMPASAGMDAILGTDQGVCGRFAIAPGWVAAVYDAEANHSSFANTWAGLYAGVRDANLLLARIGDSPLTQEIKGSVRAQALFYRATFYFELTTLFGDVPYWRDEINMAEVSLLGQTAANTIQNEMISDLDEAITSGYLSSDRWNQNNGRPTEWSVRMLKAHFHIWQEQWSEARSELIEITQNSPHKDLSPYGEMYKEGNEAHHELIFGREYLANVQNNGSTQNIAHYNSNAENASTRTAMNQLGLYASSAATTFRKSYADSYDENDARKPYNIFGSHTLANGQVAEFNWIYITKFQNGPVPVSDPLFTTANPVHTTSMPSRIFKLSDALLLLAEAEFMMEGSSAAALDPLNRVRRRANLPELTELTMQDIMSERGWELAAEGYFGHKRDLIRWGILEETVMATPAAERAAGAYTLAISRAMDDSTKIANAPMGKFRVFPVPSQELLKSQDLGGGLVQNPLWQ
ncbi:RagB/SusD family nutrient uptake outer membrane protein [Echinicola pacifica]|nr:RagB/SusD family nutrient uptake outer membrane protein [Echinicola pacifica]